MVIVLDWYFVAGISTVQKKCAALGCLALPEGGRLRALVR